MSGEWYVTTDAVEGKQMTSEQAMDAVRSVSDGSSEFFVIEREKDSEDSFIQASSWTDGVILGGSYVAEVRVLEGGGFRQWRLRTKRFEEIEAAAESYMAGNPVHEGWLDVTDEFTDS